MSKSAVISEINSSDDFQVAIATINSVFVTKAKAYLGKNRNTKFGTQALKNSAVILLEELKKSPAAGDKMQVIDQVIGIYQEDYKGSFEDNVKQIKKNLKSFNLEVSTQTAKNPKLVKTITAECNNSFDWHHSFDWHNGNINVNKPALDKKIEAIKASGEVELLRIMTWHLSAASTFGRAVEALGSAENAQEKGREEEFALLKEDHLKDMKKGLKFWQEFEGSVDSPNLISYYINKLKNLDYAQAKELYSDTKQLTKNDAINFLDEQVKSINTIIDALPDQHRQRILKVQDDLLPKPAELAHLKILFDQEIVFYEAVYQESLRADELKSEQLEELKNFRQGMIKDVEKLQKRHQEICGLESESCKVFNDVLRGMQSHKGEELSAEKLSELKAKERKVDFRMRYLTRKDEAEYDREIEQAASKMSDSTKNLINTFQKKIDYIAVMDGALLRTADWLQHTGKENSISNEPKIDEKEQADKALAEVKLNKNAKIIDKLAENKEILAKDGPDDQKQEPPKISVLSRIGNAIGGGLLWLWAKVSKSKSSSDHALRENSKNLQNVKNNAQIAPVTKKKVDERANTLEKLSLKNSALQEQAGILGKGVVSFVVPNSIEEKKESQLEKLQSERANSQNVSNNFKIKLN